MENKQSDVPSNKQVCPDQVNEILINHFCERHVNTELEYYCVNCEKVICLRCAIIPPHDQHKKLDFIQALDHLNPILQNTLLLDKELTLTSKKAIVVSNLEIVSNLKKKREEIKAEIYQKYEQLFLTLVSKKQDLIHMLDQIIDQRLVILSDNYETNGLQDDLTSVDKLLTNLKKKDLQDVQSFFDIKYLNDKIYNLYQKIENLKLHVPCSSLEYVTLDWDISFHQTRIAGSGKIKSVELKKNDLEYEFKVPNVIDLHHAGFVNKLKEQFLSDEIIIVFIRINSTQSFTFGGDKPWYMYFITNYGRFFSFDMNHNNFNRHFDVNCPSRQKFPDPKKLILLPKYQFLLHKTFHESTFPEGNTLFLKIQQLVDIYYKEMEKELA